MPEQNSIIYQYAHEQTAATTGYFSCEPLPAPALPELMRLVAGRPLDSFLRRHTLRRLLALSGPEIGKLLEQCPCPETAASLALELLELNPALEDEDAVKGAAEKHGITDESSPLLYLRLKKIPREQRDRRKFWAVLFRENLNAHRALPKPDSPDLPPLPDFIPQLEAESRHERPEATLPGLHEFFSGQLPERQENMEKRADSGEIAALALERLKDAGISLGGEMRHQASLSPIGLLHPWKVDYRVDCVRNAYALQGQANTYGRGLSLPDALASCRMEMVERASAYASVGYTEQGTLSVLGLNDRSPEFACARGEESGGPLAGIKPGELAYGRYSDLKNKNFNPIDPNAFFLEVPYTDSPLHWMKGVRIESDGARSACLVPFQMVYLFANLDEIDLSFAPPSTGLATHASMAGAILSALTELLERDAEATTPYRKSGCFTLETDDPVLAALLNGYKASGVNVQFQDITGPLGFPCYQAFVVGPKGEISRGYGAGLSARKAIISALTETPYPYPESAPSGPLLRNLPVKKLEELPDYSIRRQDGSQDEKACLALLEKLLCANGLNPVYVELTRRDLGFPVVRALVPGLVPTSEYDEFSPLSERIFLNYISVI